MTDEQKKRTSNIHVRVKPDEFTRNAAKDLKLNLDKLVKKDLGMLKKHGYTK